MKVPQDLELVQDGVRLTSLVMAATVFFDEPPQAHKADLLAAWHAWQNWCPPERMNFYSTETMSEHRKVGPKTLRMLDAWLAPGAPVRNIVSFEIKDGATFDDSPHWMFDLLGVDSDPDDPSMIQLAVPFGEGEAGAARLRAFTGALVARLGASHAVAGYALICSPYEEEASQTFARARSMRHRGLDILLSEADPVTVGHDGIKGVNWLTFIDRARIDRLGGDAAIRAALPPAVDVIPIGTGLLLQAGALPALGDENRRERVPLYRDVFRVLAPLTVDAFDRALDLVLEDDDAATDLTLRWRRRLAG